MQTASVSIIFKDVDKPEWAMASTMTLNVRISGALGEHVAANVGENGLYENVSEYVRDLIRRDLARLGEERLQALKSELQVAFAVPESEFFPMDAETFLARMKQRHG